MLNLIIEIELIICIKTDLALTNHKYAINPKQPTN